jgi:hypothetical protein
LEFDDSVAKYVDQTGVDYTLNSWSASGPGSAPG